MLRYNVFVPQERPIQQLVVQLADISVHHWLVVWNINFYFPIYWVSNHPNWLKFFRGVQTTNQISFGWFWRSLHFQQLAQWNPSGRMAWQALPSPLQGTVSGGHLSAPAKPSHKGPGLDAPLAKGLSLSLGFWVMFGHTLRFFDLLVFGCFSFFLMYISVDERPTVLPSI